VLIVHGDDDQIVPIDAAARKAVELVPDATLEVHAGAPHGLHGDHEQAFDHHLMSFIRP
jgi:non-heme chloroperoxidase